MVILFRERESRQKHRVMNVNCNGGSIPLICMSTNIYQTVLTQKSALVFIGVCNPFCDLCEGTQGDSCWKTLSLVILFPEVTAVLRRTSPQSIAITPGCVRLALSYAFRSGQASPTTFFFFLKTLLSVLALFTYSVYLLLLIDYFISPLRPS